MRLTFIIRQQYLRNHKLYVATELETEVPVTERTHSLCSNRKNDQHFLSYFFKIHFS